MLASLSHSLLETGSGLFFQTLFADLLALGITAYFIMAIISPKIKEVRNFRKVARKVGIPAGHWLFGHVLKYGYTHEGMMNIVERCNDFPAICTNDLGFVRSFHVYHPDLTKLILSRSYPKAYMYTRFIKTFLNEGLVTSSGAVWHRNRTLLTPIFHFDILKEHTKVFNKNCKEMLDECLKISQTGKACDVTPIISNTTFNNLMVCVMSQKAQDQSGNNSRYIQGVNDVSVELMHRIRNPLLWTDFVYNMTESGKRFKNAKRTVHDEAEKIIKERRKLLETKNSQDLQSEENILTNEATGKSFAYRRRKGKNVDFLDILLQARDEAGVGLSDNEINDEVVTFFSAGQETVATALTWTLYLLSKHQDWQDKCRQEILNVLGDKEECDQSDMSKFIYVTQCIKESMRLYPPVHTVGRALTEDLTISHSSIGEDKVTLPKGATVSTSIFALHRNPHVWKHPEVFDPERFNSDIPPFAYLPFVAGPRNCIGQKFAMAQMKVVVAQVLRRFEFHYDANIPDPKLKVGITLRPENGLRLIVKPITAKN